MDQINAMTWFGNIQGRKAIENFLSQEKTDCVCFLTGPYGIGKRSFINEYLSFLPEEDTLQVKPGVDGSREVFDFLMTRPVTASARVVAVAGADLMQLPAQDSYLKILEEPPYMSKIIFISNDDGLLSSPLKSRARFISRWTCLSDNEMEAFADTFGKRDDIAIRYSCGRPGVYSVIHDDPRILPFIQSLKEALYGDRNLLLEKTPVIITEIDSTAPMRIALSQVLIKIVSECVGKIAANKLSCILKYASNLYSAPSLNAELHWMRMVSEI